MSSSDILPPRTARPHPARARPGRIRQALSSVARRRRHPAATNDDGVLHARPRPATRPRRGLPPAGVLPLYGTAAVLGGFGVVMLFVQPSAALFVYLVPLIGVFTAVAGGLQQHRDALAARRKEREQANEESLRRFDDRFAAAARAAADPGNTQVPAARMSAAVELNAFLREENRASFRRQVYETALGYLKMARAVDDSHPDEQAVDRAFVQVLQRAARLVLPTAAEWERVALLELGRARLDGADLSGLELAEAELSDTGLARATLDGACLWRAHGTGTRLGGASLRHANLEEAVLRGGLSAAGADFSFANLAAARFTSHRGHEGADLRRARFIGARLQGAILDGADLRDARFDGANLREASFRGARVNQAMLLSVLRSANLSWRKVRERGWDPETWQELKRLHQDGERTRPYRPAHRHPADQTVADYRRHPDPGHQHHLTRPRRYG